MLSIPAFARRWESMRPAGPPPTMPTSVVTTVRVAFMCSSFAARIRFASHRVSCASPTAHVDFSFNEKTTWSVRGTLAHSARDAAGSGHEDGHDGLLPGRAGGHHHAERRQCMTRPCEDGHRDARGALVEHTVEARITPSADL